MILLDTSVLLWSMSLQVNRIGPKARARIEQADAVHASAVSIAEIQIKAMLGKLDVEPEVTRLFFEMGLVELPLTAPQAEALGEFPELAGHDPFDRLLLAQAHHAGLDFMTADRALLGLGRDFIVDATV